MNYLSNASKENITEVAKTTNQLNSEVKDLIENFKDSYQNLKSLNVSSKTEKDSIISPEQYKAMLLQKGMEELNSHQSKTTIESEVDYNGIFKYKKDFDVGDIVNVSNEFGYSGKLRITEIVTSDSVNGMTIIPTFKVI